MDFVTCIKYIVMSAQVFVCEGVTVKHFRDLEEVNYSKHLYFLGLYFRDDTFFLVGGSFSVC